LVLFPFFFGPEISPGGIFLVSSLNIFSSFSADGISPPWTNYFSVVKDAFLSPKSGAAPPGLSKRAASR